MDVDGCKTISVLSQCEHSKKLQQFCSEFQPEIFPFYTRYKDTARGSEEAS